jgi:succinate-semialdehyde dehydrogenase/glutarate-semialdehyde dehydrogenase
MAESLHTQNYINGEWCDAALGAVFPVDNPATKELIEEVADSTATDVERAIDAAYDAFAFWSTTSPIERARLLHRWFCLIVEHTDVLANLMTRECGKPFVESKGEVAYGASFVEWFAEEAKRIYGDIIPAATPDRQLLVHKAPIGVCAAITPWNFPLAMITRKCAPALAAGCTVVVKPAEGTPLTALALAALAEQAGFPAGVFNVVCAAHGVEVGRVLSTHEKVRKLSFTGSTAVGKQLLKQSAETVKRVSMELGGNAPFIVFDDADLEQAIQGALASKYRNSGQTCVCANRFIVHDTVYEQFAERLKEATEALKVGNGLDAGIAIGPLINGAAVGKVSELVRCAINDGARALCGAQTHSAGDNFYMPTVLTEVSPSMAIASTEIFGPVSTLIRFAEEAEAIHIANATPFGLAAYFYTEDRHRMWRVADALDYGMIGVNEGIISTTLAPFGGQKQSGMGREGSMYGIDEYLELKYVCMGGMK